MPDIVNIGSQTTPGSEPSTVKPRRHIPGWSKSRRRGAPKTVEVWRIGISVRTPIKELSAYINEGIKLMNSKGISADFVTGQLRFDRTIE